MMTPNLAAFAQVIRACEGTAGPDGYRTLFGGSLFDSMDDHPRIIIEKNGYKSSAAGAFQILQGTWNDYQKWRVDQDLPLAKFDEEGQNACFEWLIDRRGARQAIERGDLDTAIHLCCREWASLPGSPYGQPTRSLTYCKTIFARALDDVSLKPDVAISQPIEVPESAPQPEPSQPDDKPMAPLLLIPIISALVEQIPILAKAFGPKAEKAGERIGAATAAVGAVVKAVGAVNGEDAVTKIAADPELRKAATAALLADPVVSTLITEVGGGIPAARAANAAAMAGDNWAFLRRSAVFWISIIMLPLVYWLVGSLIVGGMLESAAKAQIALPDWVKAVAMMFGTSWTGEARSGGFNLVIGLVLGGICGVYYGVSVTQGRVQPNDTKGS